MLSEDNKRHSGLTYQGLHLSSGHFPLKPLNLFTPANRPMGPEHTALRWVWTLRSNELLGSLRRLKIKRQKGSLTESVNLFKESMWFFFSPSTAAVSQVCTSNTQVRHCVVNYGVRKETCKVIEKQSRTGVECRTSVLIKSTELSVELFMKLSSACIHSKLIAIFHFLKTLNIFFSTTHL